MRNFGMPQFMDLVSDGGTSVAITPTSSVQSAEFVIQAPKAAVGDNFPLAACMTTRTRIGFDQASSGGSACNWDQLFVGLDGFDFNSPLLGNMMPRDTYSSITAKHLIEFVCAGYTYADGARIQIASTDGDTAVDLYVTLPFNHEAMERPHHSAPWLGWLNQSRLKVMVAPTTSFASISTGAASEATCNVQAWVEYYTSDELPMPVINQWHLYESPASGGTTQTLQGIGTDNGLADVLPGSRIVGLYELADALAGGAVVPGNITGWNIPQLNQDLFVNTDAFFIAYRRLMGGHRGPNTTTATGVVVDRAGNPYLQSATTALDGTQSGGTSTTIYIPIRSPGRNCQLTKQVKFLGDLKIVRTFGSTPSSGKYKFVANEFRELGTNKKKELIARTGRAGKLVPLPTGKGFGRGSFGKAREDGLPELVVFA